MTNQHYKRKEYHFQHNWTERQYFIYACFVDDLQQFYNDWIEQGRNKGRPQFFETNAQRFLEHKYWNPRNICCHTGQTLTQETIDIKVGYWTPFLWKPIHKDFKLVATQQESFECQNIDCSCNDCFFLDRVKSWCNKFDRATKVEAALCHPQNRECFKHRKSVDKAV